MTDQRNAYGFPGTDKLARAKRYAAESRQRNAAPCKCEPCRLKEQEETVIRLVRHWRIP